MKKNHNRFAVISENIVLAKERLENNGFTYLENPLDTNKPKLLVDLHNNSMWAVDDKDIENSKTIATQKHDQDINTVTVDTLLKQLSHNE